jgi:putative transposase
MVTGRTRPILGDTLGLILAVVVPAADIQDPEGAKRVVESIRGRFSRRRLVWADGISKRVIDGVASWRPAWPIRLEIVERTEPGFQVLRRRWVVERTFAWLGRCRRLGKDYEQTISSSEAFVKLAMIHLMARRLVKKLKR